MINDRLELLLSRGKFLIDQFCSRGINTFDWSMHIPARPDKDPDLVFSEIMRIAKNLKAENKRLREAFGNVEILTKNITNDTITIVEDSMRDRLIEIRRITTEALKGEKE